MEGELIINISTLIRIDILKAIKKSGASHIASAFSIVEILEAIYSSIDLNLIKFKSDQRDHVILSKGHAGIALYATLKNFGIMSSEDYETYYANGSKLSGHISHSGILGVEFSSGSLGYGLGVASGIAYSKKLSGKSSKVFCILGDGECNEGSVWESALFASHHKLNNLIVFIDQNKLQGLGNNNEIISQNIYEQFSSFGWNVIEVDGHDLSALKQSIIARFDNQNPICLIANTIKGKGVSFMENNNMFHYKDPQGEEFIMALEELNK